MTGAFTMEGWFYIDSDQPGSQTALFGLNSSSNGNRLLVFYLEDDKQFSVYKSESTLFTSERNDFEPGHWYHVAVTYDGSDVSLYVSGEFQGSKTSSIAVASSDNFSLGQEWDNSGSSDHLKGKLDEIRVWDVAKDATAIADGVYSEFSGTEDNLVALWKLDDAANSDVALDATGNGYDGEVSGGLDTSSQWGADPADLPTFQTLHPQNLAAGVTLYESIRIDYEHPVTKSAGTISLMNGATLVESISVDDAVLSSDGLSLTLPFSEDLDPATDYHIEFDAGLVLGFWGTPSVGASDDGTWSFTTGRGAGSLAFDGEDDYVTANSVTAGMTASFTMEGWFYLDSAQTSSAGLFTVNTSGGGNRFVVQYAPATQQFKVDYPVGSLVSTNSGYEAGRWYHVAVTYDETTTTLYINGQNEGTSTSGFNLADADLFSLGQEWNDDTASAFLIGKVDNVRIWNVAKDASDVQNDMFATLDGSEDNLLALWTFDDADNSEVARDITSNGYDAELSPGFATLSQWVDTQADEPIASAFSPDINATGIDRQQFLQIEFSQPVSIGTGNFHIVQGGQILESIAVSNASLSGNGASSDDGTTLTFIRGVSLEPGLEYYIEADAGAVVGTWGSEWVGLSGSTEWTFTAGPTEHALDFDGVDDYVSVANTVAIGDTYTIEAWVKPSGSGPRYIVELRNADGDLYSSLLVRGTNAGGFIHRVPAGAADFSDLNSGLMENDTWHHIAAVKDSDSVLMYVNGVVVAEVSNSQSINDDVVVHIGRREPTGTYYSGHLDDIRIWSDARSQSEIKDNMFEDLSGAEENLLSYWSLDRDEGTDAPDLTGRADGVLVNMDDQDWVEESVQVKPIIFTPADDELNASVIGDLVITFDRFVEKGTGNIVLMDGATAVATIDVTSDQVTIADEVVTITHGLTLDKVTEYHVLIDNSAFSGNWTGISDSSTWNFKTDDSTNLLALVPADDAVDAGIQQVLQLQFDLPVAVSTGDVVLRDGSNNVVATIDVTSDQVVVSDDRVLVYLDVLLEENQAYNVQVDAGAITGAFGTDWNGISDATSWNFTTGSSPASGRGNVLTMDGDDYLDASRVTPLLEGAFSMEGWFFTSTSQGESAALFAVNDPSDNNANIFQIYHEPAGARFWHHDGESTYTDGDFPLGRWNHVAVTVDASRNLTLYINGVSMLAFEQALPISGDYLFSIGAEWDDVADNFLIGSMDEIRIWGDVRTADEIRASMRLAVAGDEQGLLAYYQFEGTDTGFAYDTVGGLTGTLKGDPIREASTAPMANDFAINNEGPGTIDFIDTGISIAYISEDGHAVHASRIDGAPNNPPALGSSDTVFESQYWILERFDDPGLFEGSITFSPLDNLSSSEAAVPEQVQLYRRPAASNSADDWEIAASASRVDEGANTVTFSGIQELGEFLIVDSNAWAGTVTATDGTGGIWENRVHISWDTVPAEAAVLQIVRTNTSVGGSPEEALSFLASDVTEYDDYTGTPGDTYAYCVKVFDDANSDSANQIGESCDSGMRFILPPDELEATQGTLTDRIALSWKDNSGVESGYYLYRGGELLETLAANTSYFEDTDEALEAGTPYTYCVQAFDTDDNRTADDICTTGFVGAVLPPLEVSASDGQYPDYVQLTWTNQATDATGITIERQDLDGNVLATIDLESDANSYNDTNASAETVYNYCVYSVSDAGTSTGVCDEGNRGLLPAPENLTASSDLFDSHVELKWTDASDTETGFAITRTGTVDGVETTDDLGITDANVITYLDFSGTADIEYTYCVKAVSELDTNGDGEVNVTANSTEVCAIGSKSLVMAPTDVAVTDGDYEDRIVATWTNPSTTAALMRIGVAEDPDDPDSAVDIIKTTSASNSAYTHTSLASGKETTYCISATTAEGHHSDWVCDTGFREIAAPSDVVATDNAEEDYVEISWEDNSEVELGYYIYRTPVDESVERTVIGTNSAIDLDFVDYNGVPGTEYVYEVAAFDADGTSDTDADNGKRTLVAPTQLSASDGVSETTIELTWKDNSRVETGYQIIRDGELVATAAAKSTSWVDESPKFGVEHTYEVAATDGIGISSLSDSDTGYVTILPPISFFASDTYQDRIEINWVDQSTIEDGYELRRSEDGGTTWTVIDASLAENASSATDIPDSGVTYLYCVVAYKGDSAVSECEDAQDFGIMPIVVTTVTSSQEQALLPDDGYAAEQFGRTVAIWGDYAFAGTASENATDGVYVYERDENASWNQVQKLLLGDAEETISEISAYDGTVVVGVAEDQTSGVASGRVYVLEQAGGVWNVVAELQGSDVSSGSQFGHSVSISYNSDSNGSIITVGAPLKDNGQAYVFDYAGSSTWGNCSADAVPVCEETLSIANPGSDNQFGTYLDLDDDALMVYEEGGHVWHFDRDSGGSWSAGEDIANTGTDLGRLSISSGYLFVGSPEVSTSSGTGKVFVYKDDGSGNWEFLQEVIATGSKSSRRFGIDVFVDGTLAVIGADLDGTADQGAAYVYRLDETDLKWKLLDESEGYQLVSSPYYDDALYGQAVAVDGENIIVGAAYDDSQGEKSGAVYMYSKDIESIVSPGAVAASDGTFSSRIQVTWTDRSTAETAYRIYRNGQEIETTSPDVTSYSDFDATPGILHTYCIETVSDVFSASDAVCDYGYSPANGAITGRVATEGGAGIEDVSMCLDPSPNRALLLDGSGGHVKVEEFHLEEDLADFTMSFWMKSSDTSGEGTAFSYGVNGNDDLITIRDYQNLKVSILGEETTEADIVLTDGIWHHVAVTWDASSGGTQIYVDGEAQFASEQILSAGGSIESAGTVVFGLRQDVLDESYDTALLFDGQLDEFRIWSTVRSQSEIDEDRLEALTGDESDLVAYWPFDQDHDEGGVTLGLIGSSSHGILIDGSYTTTDAAPLNICALTDSNGNFTLDGILYGDSGTFGLSASKGSRLFSPTTTNITLSVDSPVQNEIFFSDVSAFTLSGEVQFPWVDGTVCPAEDIEMLLGTPGEESLLVGTTEKDGTFLVSADLGDHILTPQLFNSNDAGGDGLEHTFEPGFLSLTVDDNVSGIVFSDLSTRTLNIEAGGNCNTAIGPIKIKIFTENGCFEHIETIEDFEFSMELPPQRYLVQVLEVDPPSPLDKADVIEYFDQLGNLEIDLTQQDANLELIYEAPLDVSITGWPTESDNACIASDLLGVPILTQGNTVDLTIQVGQDYGKVDSSGNPELCPVDEGTIQVFDEIASNVDGVIELELADGQASYALTPGSPNILAGLVVDNEDRSYQKPITIIADVEGRDPTTVVDWAIVTGDKIRTAEFTTLTTEPIPLMILRDPPGDGSSATWKAGEEVCSTVSNMFVSSYSGVTEVEVKSGSKTESGAWAGVGAGAVVTQESNATTKLKDEYELGVETESSDVLTVCTTIAEDISTSSGDTFIGEDADIIVGAGFNIIFANTDFLEVGETCEIDISERVVGGLNSEEAFSTAYTYTHRHIEQNIIPTLEELLTTACDEGEESCTVTDPDFPDAAIPLTDVIDNWRAQLALKEELTYSSLESGVTNRSFDAGTDYSYSTQTDSSSALNFSVKAYLNLSYTTNSIFTFAGNGGQVNFTYKQNFAYNYSDSETTSNSLTTGYTLSDNDLGDSFTVDVATDSNYGTPVFDLRSGVTSDPWEPGKEFENEFEQCSDGTWDSCEPTTRAGYPFSQPRDYPVLSITPPEITGADPDNPAVFTLGLGNASESEEARRYVLRTISSSNPHGAVIKANGGSTQKGQEFLVDPSTTQNVTLSVERGPSKYDYENLGIVAYTPGEWSVWEDGGNLMRADTVYFSVAFDAVCSEISLLRPLDPWSRNGYEFEIPDGDSEVRRPLDIIVNGFVLNSPDLTIDELGAEYRASGTAKWLPITSLYDRNPSDGIAEWGDGTDDGILLTESSTSFDVNWNPGKDGTYEIRAFTDCAGNRVYSEVAVGTIDTSPPVALGNPEPADQVLNLGDEISITFAEEVSCPEVEDGNVLLTDADGNAVDFTLACDGREVVLSPVASLASYEGQTLTVMLPPGASDTDTSTDSSTDSASSITVDSPLTDVLGNEIEEAITWEFLVSQSAVSFAPVNAEVDVSKGFTGLVATSLTNGRAGQVSFEIEEFDMVNLDNEDNSTTLSPTTTSGTIVQGGSALIDIDIPRTLESGAYEGTMTASISDADGAPLGTTDFRLNMEILCRLPTEIFPIEFFTTNTELEVVERLLNPANYEYNMTYTAQIEVDGVVSTDDADAVIAFVDGEVRGLDFLTEIDDGKFQVNMVIFSDSDAGEVVTFQIWDASACALLTDVGPSFSFEADDISGTALNPLTIASPAASTDPGVIVFDVGWNWFSINRDFDDSSIQSVLDGLPLTSGDQFKNHDGSVAAMFGLSGSSWLSSSSEATALDLVPGEGYQLKLAESGSILMEASAVSLTNSTYFPTIGSSDGEASWSWIGYLPTSAMCVDGALSNVTDASGAAMTWTSSDLIKSQVAYAQYLNGFWVGSLEEMKPGLAYQMYVQNQGSIQFPDPADFDCDADAESETASDSGAGKGNPGDSTPGFRYQQYTNTMSVTASPFLNGIPVSQESMRLQALVDGELRGEAPIRYVRGVDRNLAFMTVFSNRLGGETVQFRLVDQDSDQVVDLAQALEFGGNGVVGHPLEPFVLSSGLATSLQIGTLPEAFKLDQNYPNPFNPTTTIRYSLPVSDHVVLTVHDILGREIERLVDQSQTAGRYEVQFDAGRYASGVYLYRIQSGSHQATRRMLLLK